MFQIGICSVLKKMCHSETCTILCKSEACLKMANFSLQNMLPIYNMFGGGTCFRMACHTSKPCRIVGLLYKPCVLYWHHIVKSTNRLFCLFNCKCNQWFYWLSGHAAICNFICTKSEKNSSMMCVIKNCRKLYCLLIPLLSLLSHS